MNAAVHLLIGVAALLSFGVLVLIGCVWWSLIQIADEWTDEA